VPPTPAIRRRPKVTTTLAPELLALVDAHVAAHPGLDRSAVFDQALRLWCAHELERALEAQFAEPDGVPPAERASWNRVRGAAGAGSRGRPSGNWRPVHLSVPPDQPAAGWRLLGWTEIALWCEMSQTTKRTS
jgi:hypothetical protein